MREKPLKHSGGRAGECRVPREKMMKICFESEINQSPELVFPWIEDPEKAMKWQKNVKGGEIIEKNPNIIGTTFTEIVEEDGNSLPMSGTITKYIKNKMIGFHITSKIHEFDVAYAVEGIGKATKLSIDADIHWKFPMNIMSIFLRKRMEEGLKKQMELEVQDLKKLCAGA
jgi:uncharacterized protein YndB with AHSA1/START domain